MPTATGSNRSQTYCYSDIVSQLLSVTDVYRNYSSTALAPPRCGGRGTPRRGLLSDIILFVLVIFSGLVPVDADCPGLCDDGASAAQRAHGALNGDPLWLDVVPLWLDVVPGCLSPSNVYGDWCVDVPKLSWPGAASQPRPLNTKASSLFLENSQCCSNFRLNALLCFRGVGDGWQLSLVEWLICCDPVDAATEAGDVNGHCFKLGLAKTRNTFRLSQAGELSGRTESTCIPTEFV